MINYPRAFFLLTFASTALLLTSCHTARPRTFVPRKGDEIVVAGQLFHTGTRVITWMDPGGYDAYRTERRFSDLEESSFEKTKEVVKDIRSPNRYGLRRDPSLAPAEIERVRGGGWDLPTLQGVIDQFVIHYDVAGTSKTCFKVLHDMRGLSVHFMLDIDGTIYQTLDLKERAYHATTSNTRSVGIEIANMGAYPQAIVKVLDEWYPRDAKGPYIHVPERFGDPMIYTKNFVGRPARPELVRGVVQGTELVQYDFTPEQYAALTKLTAALCKVFPKITCDYPHGEDGKPLPKKLPDEQLKAYHGVLGHYHVQTNKTDPGPAFDWDRVVGGARRLLGLPERAATAK
jgi:N-acetyl-anhydromuramyl-L-alanine amidase AmpD